MSGRDYDLKTILNIPLFEALQDILAKTTGTAIITVDYKGTPVTRHSCRTEFCSVIRENPISRKRCFRCDALAGLEAVRLNSPFIYLCHCGIVDVAVPVEVMNALHAEGKIGAFGGSNWTHQRIEEANEYAYRRGLIHVTVSSPNFGLADQVQMGLSEGEILYLNLRK